MEKVIAVIVTYNRIKLLKECLNAVLSQTYKVHKIVLIDNASTDGTADLFIKGGEYDKDVIDYRRMETNLGGAGGFYEGIKICRDMECDYVWIMDDDTIPYTDCLEKLMSARSKIEGKIGYLASSIIGPDSEPMNVPAIDIHNFKIALQKLLKGDFIRAKVIFLGTLDSITQRKKFEEYIEKQLSNR